MKLLLVIALLAQLFAFAGPVCGNHVSTKDSMACCEKGHNDRKDGIHDPHSAACCNSCDMGKTAGIKKQEVVSVQLAEKASALEVPAVHTMGVWSIFFRDAKHEYPPGRSDIPLLKQPLRI